MKEIDCFVVQVFVSSSQNYRSNVSYKLKELFDMLPYFFLFYIWYEFMYKARNTKGFA